MVSPRRFRPAPSRLKHMRYGARYRGDLRAYGLVTTMEGKKKRLSFQVDITPYLRRKWSKRDLRLLIIAMCNAIKDKKVPVHRMGDVFSGFAELFFNTKWVKVRKVHWYDVGVHYER